MTLPEYKKHDCNIPLKTPRHTRAKMIYQGVNELLSVGSSDFIPTWDLTDHFHFCCAKCACIADVLQVRFYPNYVGDSKGTKLYALFIFLGCPKCGATGFRKIYFKPIRYTGQIAFTDKKQVHLFGDGKEAVGTVQFEHPKEKPRAVNENDSSIL